MSSSPDSEEPSRETGRKLFSPPSEEKSPEPEADNIITLDTRFDISKNLASFEPGSSLTISNKPFVNYEFKMVPQTQDGECIHVWIPVRWTNVWESRWDNDTRQNRMFQMG